MAGSDPERETNDVVRLGPLSVHADPAQIAAFNASLGLPQRPLTVPLTYPIRWLMRPEISQAVANVLGAQPVQISQRFDYTGAVQAGADYVMDVVIQRHHAPSRRATLRSTVHGQNGDLVLALETVLCSVDAIAAVARANAPPIGKGPLPEIAIAPIDAAQVERYAAAADDRNPLHSDSDFARAIGLDGPIVHGMMIMSLFQRALTAWFPAAAVTRLSALFIQPVLVGHGLTIAGRIASTSRTAGHDIQILRLFVRTGRDRLACIGEAALNVDPRTQLPSVPTSP